MSRKRIKMLCVGITLALIGAMAAAATVRAEGPPPLPEEAFTACASKASGDACTVQIRDLTTTGTCTAQASDGRMFCRPDHMPPRPDGSGRP